MLSKLYQWLAIVAAGILAIFMIRRDAKADANKQRDLRQQEELNDAVKKARDVEHEILDDDAVIERMRKRNR